MPPTTDDLVAVLCLTDLDGFQLTNRQPVPARCFLLLGALPAGPLAVFFFFFFWRSFRGGTEGFLFKKISNPRELLFLFFVFLFFCFLFFFKKPKQIKCPKAGVLSSLVP